MAKFGKVDIVPSALVGMTKTEFKAKYKGKPFLPHSIDDVWEEIKNEIPKKEK